MVLFSFPPYLYSKEPCTHWYLFFKGVAVILVHDIKKAFYKKFLYEPFPVESHLLGVLPDHLNAEVRSERLIFKGRDVSRAFIHVRLSPSLLNLCIWRSVLGGCGHSDLEARCYGLHHLDLLLPSPRFESFLLWVRIERRKAIDRHDFNVIIVMISH